jgi:hypothetical protein
MFELVMLHFYTTYNVCIGCSFKYLLKVGVEQSIVNMNIPYVFSYNIPMHIFFSNISNIVIRTIKSLSCLN